MIERTINELGGVFGQLAAMVSEQGSVYSIHSIENDTDMFTANKYNE